MQFQKFAAVRISIILFWLSYSSFTVVERCLVSHVEYDDAISVKKIKNLQLLIAPTEGISVRRSQSYPVSTLCRDINCRSTCGRYFSMVGGSFSTFFLHFDWPIHKLP